jgi:hypothetical protein
MEQLPASGVRPAIGVPARRNKAVLAIARGAII